MDFHEMMARMREPEVPEGFGIAAWAGNARVSEEAAMIQMAVILSLIAGQYTWQMTPAGQKRLPATRPFHELDNVVMTPHKPTQETMDYRWGEIAKNIANYAAGQELKNVVCRNF